MYSYKYYEKKFAKYIFTKLLDIKNNNEIINNNYKNKNNKIVKR